MTITSTSIQDDYPHPVLLLRQGTLPASLRHSALLTRPAQVIADLWERYMKLLEEGVSDG